MSRITKWGFANVLGTAVGIASVAGITGCSDSKPVDPPPVKASAALPPKADTIAPAAGLPTYRDGLVKGQKQIDSTLAALAELADPNQQNVRGAYDKYCDQLARLRQHAETVKIEADAMRGSREEYFGKWEEKVSEIDNPTIRASAEARRKRLREAHEQIVTTSGEARDAYVPFVKDLDDIKKYLAADQSKAAISDLGEAVKKVNTDGAVVKQKIGSIVETLDSVHGGN